MATQHQELLRGVMAMFSENGLDPNREHGKINAGSFRKPTSLLACARLNSSVAMLVFLSLS